MNEAHDDRDEREPTLVDEGHHLNVLVVDGERLYTIEHTAGCGPVYVGKPGAEFIDTYGCELSRLIADLGNEDAIDGAAPAPPGRYRLRYTEGEDWGACVIVEVADRHD